MTKMKSFVLFQSSINVPENEKKKKIRLHDFFANRNCQYHAFANKKEFRNKSESSQLDLTSNIKFKH